MKVAMMQTQVQGVGTIIMTQVVKPDVVAAKAIVARIPCLNSICCLRFPRLTAVFFSKLPNISEPTDRNGDVFEYFTLPHLFRLDSGLSSWNFWNFWNPVEFFLYAVFPL
jgi:hypothetical protein